MAEHAKKFSASSADRWVRCAGSVNAVEGIEQTTSIYAEEGTKAHEYAAQKLDWFITDHMVEKKDQWDISLEDSVYLQKYTDYILHLYQEAGGIFNDSVNLLGKTKNNNSFLYIEQQLNYANLSPKDYDTKDDFFGTADAIIYDENTKTLHVVDLKWGKGVRVDYEENYQLICYAIGAVNEYSWLYEIENVELHIVQPRMNNIGNVKLTIAELQEYAEKFKQAIQAALQPDAKRTPHDKACKFCPAKLTCPALLELTKNAVISNFEKLELSDDDYRYILDNSDLISNFIKSVEEKTYNKLVAGGSLEGYKLVQGRSTRKWTEDAEEALKDSLGEAAYSKKLIGVTEADKKIPKEVMEELTQKEIGKPLLVKQEDKRQELIINETLTILEA